jgi:prepilin peptidase CpaA
VAVLLDLARLLVFPALMAFAASSDLLTMTISNRVSILLAIGFGGLAAATGMPLGIVLGHLGAGLLVLAIGFVFFARGWIGGGDAKLAAAAALWLGWGDLYDYFLCASLLGGWLTLALIEFRRCALPPLLAGRAWIERLHRTDGDVPYGVALATAALVVYPTTAWMAPLG